MKAFLSAVVVAILLAVGAAFALNWLDRSTASVEQTPTGNVRL
jgi:hypothetical protein